MALPTTPAGFVLAARRSHPDKLAKTQPAHTHPEIAPRITAAAFALASAVMVLVAFVCARLNQGQSGACTAHSFVAALATRLGFVSQELQTIVDSPKEVYATARAWERAAGTPLGALPPLTDEGAELADVIASVAVFGVTPMVGQTPDGRRSDVWTTADVAGIPNAPPANVNDEPDGAQLENAAGDPLSGAYTIALSLPSAVQTAVASLQSGYTLYFGFFCDSAFQALQFGEIAQAPNTNDPNGGGHAVFLAAARPSPTVPGTVEFLLVNSWDGWAGAIAQNDGMVWVSQAFFLAGWECWVVDEKLVGTRKAAA